MTSTTNQPDFVATLEALTKEPVWLTILGLAGAGLITLPDWVKKITVERLESIEDKRPPTFTPQQAMRAVRRLQDGIAVCGGSREVFRSFIESGGHKREDGSLRTYREIASIFGDYHSPMTYCRWMRHGFPEIAKAMRQTHLH